MKVWITGLSALALTAPATLAAAPAHHKPVTVAPKPATSVPVLPAPVPLPVFEFMGQTTEAPRTMTALQGEVCRTIGTKTACDNYSSATLAGRPMRYISMEFLNDRLFMVLGSFLAVEYQSVADAFTAKYGQPTQTEVRKWQSRAGATFNNTVLIWKFKGGGTLELESMGSKVDQGIFMFVSAENSPPAEAPKVDF